MSTKFEDIPGAARASTVPTIRERFMDTGGLLFRLLRDGDFRALSAALEEQIQVTVDPRMLQCQCAAANPLEPSVDGVARADDTVMMWLRNRLDEMRVIDVGCQSETLSRFATYLNVGFVHLVETAEMLKRLRKNPNSRKNQVGRRPPSSRISDCYYRITPINRVAARVVGRQKRITYPVRFDGGQIVRLGSTTYWIGSER